MNLAIWPPAGSTAEFDPPATSRPSRPRSDSLITSDTPVEMRLSLRGLDGREVAGGSNSAVLPAGGHIAKFIDELFPGVDASSFQGTLVVRSSGLEQSVTATTIHTGGSVG